MKRKQKKHHPSGVVAVEASLVLPVFIFITLGALQYGWLFLKYQEITNVARHAIRRCSRPDVDCPNTRAWIDNEMAKHGFASDEFDKEVAWVNGSGTVGDPIYVKLWVYAPKVDIINFFPVPAKLTAYCTMSEEGPNYTPH